MQAKRHCSAGRREDSKGKRSNGWKPTDMAAPVTGVGQSASSEAIAARCLSLVELALSTEDS